MLLFPQMHRGGGRSKPGGRSLAWQRGVNLVGEACQGSLREFSIFDLLSQAVSSYIYPEFRKGWYPALTFQGMEKLFTGLFTPSLLPVACADSTK
jgi:hypothetical protein